MTNEEKQLLLKDLCARLPYGVIFQSRHNENGVEGEGTFDFEIGDNATLSKLKYLCETDNNKPYLRSMSNMTEEEKREFIKFRWTTSDGEPRMYEWCDYANAHHFDYRGLIEKGLAIIAPEGMYNLE